MQYKNQKKQCIANLQKTAWFWRIIGNSCAAIVLAVNCSLAWSQDSVIISSGEWAPFTSENLSNFGIGPHIITAAFKKVGMKVEYRWYPWSRAMKEAEDGNVDFSAIWVFNKERGQRFTYSKPVVNSKSVFFYRSTKIFDWDGYETFPDGMLVGTTRGYSYGQEFDNAARAAKFIVDVTRTDALNFKKLIRGRIDLFPIDELVGYDLLKTTLSKSDIVKLTAHPRPLADEPMHLIRSKNHPKGNAIIEQFNTGIELLRSSGEYDKILNEYK